MRWWFLEKADLPTALPNIFLRTFATTSVGQINLNFSPRFSLA